MSTSRSQPSVRQTHVEYIASLTDRDLAGAEDSIVDQPAAEDLATLHAWDKPLLIQYPAPRDLIEVVWEAENSTVPTIGDEGPDRSGVDTMRRTSPIRRSTAPQSQPDCGSGRPGSDRPLPPEIWGRSNRGRPST